MKGSHFPLYTHTLLLLVATALLLSACGGSSSALPAHLLNAQLPDPNKDLKIHLTMGNDPSNLIGRFIPEDIAEGDINTTVAMQTRCSAFIKPRVSTSNVEYDEYFQAGGSIKAKVNLPAGTSLGGSASDSVGVRIQYNIEKIMEADITDPAAFSQCCQSAPDQCTGRYIGRVVYGSGQIYQQQGSLAEFDGGIEQIKSYELEAKWGKAWNKGSKFTNIYFGFEMTHTPAGPKVCEGDWSSQVPTNLDGDYFVGSSPESLNEADADEAARRSARLQVVQFLLGEYLSQESEISSSLIDGVKDDETILKAATQGVAKGVQVLCYKRQSIASPKGQKSQVKALGYLLKTDRKRITHEMLDAVLQNVGADSKQGKSIKKIKASLGK